MERLLHDFAWSGLTAEPVVEQIALSMVGTRSRDVAASVRGERIDTSRQPRRAML